MWIISGDIRDQTRKLSVIAPNFGRFFALPNFLGRTFQKLYPRYQPCIAARPLKRFGEDTPTSPEVIEPNTLNFRPNFIFSRLKFLRGSPSPFECALARLAQSLARVKISGRNTPYGPKYVSQISAFSGSNLTSRSL